MSPDIYLANMALVLFGHIVRSWKLFRACIKTKENLFLFPLGRKICRKGAAMTLN
jgi:hypothetical protein